MILMPLVMVLPFIALPIFWLRPLAAAIPIYAVCLLVWGSMMWVMRTSMKLPVTTGIESLIGKEAKVIAPATSDPIAPYRVRIEGEIWRASSRDPLKQADSVIIVAVEGNKLTVECKDQHAQAE